MGGTVQGKRRLFIIGAGDFGRELENWLELIPSQERDWEIAGYLDDNRKALDGYPSGYKILGDGGAFKFERNDLCIIAIADPEGKKKIYHKLKDKVEFYTYISPDVVIGKYNEIGKGCIICPGCILTTNITMGEFVTINIGTQIGHDVKIGDFTSIMPNVNISGKCEIGDNVYIGTDATIIPSVKVGDNAKIGASSVVIRNVKENITVFGSPAQKIFKR